MEAEKFFVQRKQCKKNLPLTMKHISFTKQVKQQMNKEEFMSLIKAI